MSFLSTYTSAGPGPHTVAQNGQTYRERLLLCIFLYILEQHESGMKCRKDHEERKAC